MSWRMAFFVALFFGVSTLAAGDTGGGTIYFSTSDYVVWTMSSDGTGKAALPTGVPYDGVPSGALHGGHRWLLDIRDIPGESYPNGQTRRELFAVRDDANGSVQLTNQPDLETTYGGFGRCGFKHGDGEVWMTARRWAGGQVVEGGVYAAQILFDANGDVTGLGAQPAAPAIAATLVTWPQSEVYKGGLGPDMWEVDWAPGGTEVVYSRVSQSANSQALRIADTSGGNRLLVSGASRFPAWSPDGTNIAFHSTGGISTIKPDGTGLKVAIKRGSGYTVLYPHWSPTGSHIAYQQVKTNVYPNVRDVYRAKADGKEQTNLTGDITLAATPSGWR